MLLFKILTLFLISTLVKCDLVPYVVNGYRADINTFPHSAHLGIYCVYENGDDESWACGASILNQKLLLTAAHCLHTCGAGSAISVRVGSNNKNSGRAYKAKSFLVHPRYICTSEEIANDVALIKVRGSFKFGKSVQRVAIVKDPPYTEKAIIAGWGQIDEIKKLSTNNLQFVEQFVMNTKDCKELYKISRGVICASSKREEQYSSRGDSGSALTVRNFIQIGIVSYKIPKKSRSIVMYTDTGYFYDWIKKYSDYLYCS